MVGSMYLTSLTCAAWQVFMSQSTNDSSVGRTVATSTLNSARYLLSFQMIYSLFSVVMNSSSCAVAIFAKGISRKSTFLLSSSLVSYWRWERKQSHCSLYGLVMRVRSLLIVLRCRSISRAMRLRWLKRERGERVRRGACCSLSRSSSTARHSMANVFSLHSYLNRESLVSQELGLYIILYSLRVCSHFAFCLLRIYAVKVVGQGLCSCFVFSSRRFCLSFFSRPSSFCMRSLYSCIISASFSILLSFGTISISSISSLNSIDALERRRGQAYSLGGSSFWEGSDWSEAGY